MLIKLRIHGFLGCNATYCGGWILMFWRTMFLPSSTQKMEVAYSYKTLVPNHHTKWHNNPENHEFYLHCCENLKYLHKTHTAFAVYKILRHYMEWQLPPFLFPLVINISTFPFL
jgi:hypothetical protein